MDRFLYEKEAEELLMILKKEDKLLFILCDILYRTGRRVTEVLNLKARNILELDNDYFRVTFHMLKKQRRTKRGNKVFPPIVVAIKKEKIKEWNSILFSLGSEKERRFFFSLDKEIPINIGTISQRYRRFIQRNLEINTVREVSLKERSLFHVWRHSYAWRLHNEKKESLEGLKEALGHESIETTNKFYGSWYFDPRRRYLDF